MPEKGVKRGLSGKFIVILIVILLIIGAIVGLFFLREKLSNGKIEDVNKYEADLKISHAQLLNYSDINVNVNKPNEEDNVEAIIFIFYDNNTEVTRRKVSILSLEEVNFQVVFHFANASRIDKISIIPVFKSSSGKEVTGEVEDQYVVESKNQNVIEEPDFNDTFICKYNSQCEDHNNCTINTCLSNGTCSYEQKENCVSCEENYQCEDLNACTTNKCFNGICTYLQIPKCVQCYDISQCEDNNSCTEDICFSGRCMHNILSNCGTSINITVNNQTNQTNNTNNQNNSNQTIPVIQCTNSTQCNDYNSCTRDSCSANKCVFINITSCISGDGCCPNGRGCTYSNDNDCLPLCGNNIKEGTEKCDGTSLGGATCAGVLGTGYTGTLLCTNCMFNTSLCVAPCTQTCQSLGYTCGNRTICGVKVDCGNCSTGFNCNVNGSCMRKSNSPPSPTNSTLKYFVKDGVGNADIIISSNAPSSVQLAAKELQTYIQKMSGATLAIGNTPDNSKGYHIYIGKSSYTDSLGINTNGCKHDGFKIISGENYLVLIGYDTPFHYTFPSSYSSWDALTGHYWENPATIYNRRYSRTFNLWEGDGKGSLNAVYEFLQNQGVRWYYPGEIGEVVPTKKDIGFNTSMNLLKNPDFELRQWFQYNTEYKDENQEEIKWQLRMRLTTDDVDVGPALFHGLYSVTMRDEQRSLHPDYYDYSADYGYQSNLCSAGLFKEDLEYIRFMYDTYNVPMVSVMPTDGMTYAAQQCEEKNNFNRNEYGAEHSGQGWISDYVWPYVNNIALELYNKYPDKKVSCSAYVRYTLPPLTINQFSPNVVVFMDRPGSTITESPEDQMEFYTAITNDWLKKIPSKTIYTGGFFLYQDRQKCPIMYPHLLEDQFRFYKGKSKGDFMEIRRTGGPSSQDYEFAGYGADPYITAQLYWDNNLDVDVLLNEYYTLYYGPAAADMKQFMEYAEDSYWRCDSTRLNNLKQIASRAKTKAGNTIYGQRIDMLINLMNS